MRTRSSNGFTLIELMIVIVIIAILAAIALPAYRGYVQRAQRADAKHALLEIQLNQEKWRANHSTYSSTLGDVWGSGTTSLDGYYTLNVSSGAASAYSATAVPTGAQTGDDCGTFAINVNGEDSTGSNASSDCWNR